MKNIALLFFAILFATIAQAQKTSVTIHCTQTADYCGGAAPTDEILEELHKPQPIANQLLYIIKGTKYSQKIYKKVQSDGLGNINIKLPRGSYVVYTANQLKKFVPKKNDDNYIWDNACLLKMHQQPLLKFNTTTKTQHTINIHRKCFYSQDCGNFIGQMPA